jgi:hypothetical protein
MKRPLHAKIGFGLILAGVGPLVFLVLWTEAHNFTPIDIPIVLKPGEVRSPKFKSQLNGLYIMSLGVDDARGPTHDLELCMMGVRLPLLNCGGIDQTVDFDWQVISDKGEVLEGGAYQVAGIGPPGVQFAEFQGTPGSHQSMDLKIKRDAGELNSFHPRLVVELSGENSEAIPYLFELFIIWAGALGVLGVLMIVVPTFSRRFKGSRARRAG